METTQQPIEPAAQWLTVSEAAAIVKTRPRTIYHAIKFGLLKASKINARGDLRTSPAWLQAFMEKAATPDPTENRSLGGARGDQG